MIQALGLVAKDWNFEVLSFFEERSAAFFALGRAKRDQRPVVVSVTSGTAAAELLPAAIEAHATDVPLILVTADRPREHRGSGSPQSMWQVGLFSQYAPTLVDWQEGETFPDWARSWDQRSPVHINLCHQEPLWEKQPAVAVTPSVKPGPGPLPTITAPFPDFKKPLVLLGALPREDRAAVEAFCKWYGAPVLTEASSGLREVQHPLWLKAGERVVRAAWKRGEFDAVVRFGSVPSWRLWRDLEKWSGPVVTFGASAWSGLPGRSVHRGALSTWLGSWQQHGPKANSRTEILDADSAAFAKTQDLFMKFPSSEPSLVQALSLQAQAGSVMYLGNSRPVRDWNDYATHTKAFEIHENRGLNGIDGQVSSFLGHCRAGTENWALLGDITTLYDLAGPWALRHLSASAKVRLVVMNNQGGRIFERLFPDKAFINDHEIEFADWAQMWKCDYGQTLTGLSERAVIELRPDNAQTRAFREEVEKL